MDRRNAQERPPSRRTPLGDATSRANASTPARSHVKGQSLSPSPGLPPRNESIVPAANGTLTVRNPTVSPVNKRLSNIIDKEQRDTKRDSAISNVSTNASDTGRRRKRNIGPWQLGMTVGSGGCSRVRLVRHTVTGQWAAAKIISKAMAETVRAQSLANLVKSAEQDPGLIGKGRVIPFGLEREIVIMKLLEHKNIVRLYDVWENRNELYLIMEYVEGGELFGYIAENGSLNEMEVVYLFRQIIAALLYCHRIHIHHRDLKPENILLDRRTMEIKLVDFGMAALQPEGRYLSTPCGSPHYAAPEVLRAGAYDGGQADVWSCGVILYVMLTGTPPFNFPGDAQHLRRLFAAIAVANYVMPDDISREAQDLIYNILMPDPKRRISIEAIWDHPFLNKYNAEFGYSAEQSRKEHWIGPRPRIQDWKILKKEEIDREVLRNMRTLWHSEKEEALIQKLTSNEANHEKYFYTALMKHRDEHLENYTGNPGGVGYSASDHHHAKLMPGEEDPPPLPTGTHQRSKSAFSILNDEHLQSRHNLHEPFPSGASYDPFRASREPSLAHKKGYMNVTVHRGSSSGAKKRKSATIKPGSLRVEALRANSQRNSTLSSTPGSTRRSTKHYPGITRSSMSRSSLASSMYPSSPPIIISGPHKRGVSFSHLRRSSTASALTSRLVSDATQDTPEQLRSQRISKRDPTIVRPGEASSPVTQPKGIIRFRKEKETVQVTTPGIRVRKHPTDNRILEHEARKASTELGKFCEEAFNRSSVDSSARTSVTDRPTPYSDCDTPPSSVGPSPYAANKLLRPSYQNRPLPPLPVDSPNTYAQRELAQTRERLAIRYAEEGGETLEGMISQLDNLLRPAGKFSVADKHRIASASHAEHLRYPSHLPPIEEDGRFPDADESLLPKERNRGYRAVTEPFSRRPAQPASKYVDHNTIRLVDPSSPTPIAPLNIRKRSAEKVTPQAVPDGNREPRRNIVTALGSISANARNSYRASQDFSTASAAAVNKENANPSNSNKEGPASRKRSWFRRKTSNPEEKHDPQARIPEPWRISPDRTNKQQPPILVQQTSQSSNRTSTASSEFSIRPAEAEKSEKKGSLFGKMFGKKGGEKKDYISNTLELGSPTNCSTPSLTSAFDLAESDDPSTGARRIEAQNWLSRFLHIKPASRVLCFQVGRGRARTELVRLLRDWKRFGVKDVTFDRRTNVVGASVDKANHLKIKPVTFIAELYVVLEHGRRAQLCLARFTQTKGAASSFKKVVEIVEDVFKARGLLIEEEERKRAVAEVLGGGA
ncbi:serine/threonine-protein kinase gin4 [Coniosporium apollinis]|uniref:non-specific serine/threonine protein kinase n=1 Tax=Coniosporium apollinis TaxID=61459 RepID=A0ABQ9NWD3_9PEZI|nr:serine/threonine-protein kinase gin4 [Coniosporium apollinis]